VKKEFFFDKLKCGDDPSGREGEGDMPGDLLQYFFNFINLLN